MTLGKDGAIVSNGTETIKFKTLATEVVDTTGAGDAFWGGFYTALTSKRSFKYWFCNKCFQAKKCRCYCRIAFYRGIKNTL